VADPVWAGPLPPAARAVVLALPLEPLLPPLPRPPLLALALLPPPARDVDPDSPESAVPEAERMGSL
jgi:hypothetical protein